MISKSAKAAYDKEYYRKNRELLRIKKRVYFQKTYDPVAAAIKRHNNMPRHCEYCRQPRYKRYKSEYDRDRRALVYGPFADAYRILLQLRAEIKRLEPDRFERYRQAKRFAWNPDIQKRRREHARKKQEEFVRSIGINGL